MAHETKIDKLRRLQGMQKPTVSPMSLPVVDNAPVNSLAHYQAALDADLGRLKTLKTIPEKVAAKREIIETYWPFVEDYINQGHNYPNSIATTMMVWLIDMRDIARGLPLALLLIEQNQQTPTFINSDIPTFLCDQLYDWASEQLKAGQTVSPWLDDFCTKMLEQKWDVHPVPAGKPFAMLAKHKFRDSDYAACITTCDNAMAFNDKAGVKQLKKDAQAKLTD